VERPSRAKKTRFIGCVLFLPFAVSRNAAERLAWNRLLTRNVFHLCEYHPGLRGRRISEEMRDAVGSFCQNEVDENS
jgi:hypothetical protein